MNLVVPYNLGYSFDADLREVPDDPAAMRAALEWLQHLLADPQQAPQTRLQAAGMLGSCARILRDYARAEAALQHALHLAEVLGDPRAHGVNRLRLAHLRQWQGDFTASNAMFAEALDAVYTRPDRADYRDFAHQHAAKNLFDQGDYTGALAHFQAAARLRRQRGNPELLASTEHAIAVTRQRLALIGSAPHHPDQDHG